MHTDPSPGPSILFSAHCSLLITAYFLGAYMCLPVIPPSSSSSTVSREQVPRRQTPNGEPCGASAVPNCNVETADGRAIPTSYAVHTAQYDFSQELIKRPRLVPATRRRVLGCWWCS